MDSSCLLAAATPQDVAREARRARKRREALQCIGAGAGGSFAARGAYGGAEWNPAAIGSFVVDFDARYGIATSAGTLVTWQANIGAAYSFSLPGLPGTGPLVEDTGWLAPTSGLASRSILLDGVANELLCINTVGGLTLPQRMIGGNDQPGSVILVCQLASFAASQQQLSTTRHRGDRGDERLARR
jgi:hypothetical protein